MEGAVGGKEGGLKLNGAQWVSLLQNRRRDIVGLRKEEVPGRRRAIRWVGSV
jgi:hypothetical protein